MQTIQTKTIAATDTKGQRAKAISASGESVTMPFRYDYTYRQNALLAATALCHKLGWTGELVEGNTKEGFVYVWATGPKLSIV